MHGATEVEAVELDNVGFASGGQRANERLGALAVRAERFAKDGHVPTCTGEFESDSETNRERDDIGSDEPEMAFCKHP